MGGPSDGKGRSSPASRAPPLTGPCLRIVPPAPIAVAKAPPTEAPPNASIVILNALHAIAQQLTRIEGAVIGLDHRISAIERFLAMTERDDPLL